YVSDGKGGVELPGFKLHVGEQMGRLRVVEYVPSGSATEREMLPKVMARLPGRQRWMRDHGVRKIEKSSQENPLVIVIIDELTLIRAELKGGTGGNLGKLLTQGRAGLFVAWMATQDGHVQTIPGDLRSLIPTRICFATDTPESTTAILGASAENLRGARCSQLDPVADSGICYAGNDSTRMFDVGRVPWVSEHEVDL